MATVDREATLDVILGCIIGGAIGDAAGAAFENAPPDDHHQILDREGWRLTDDTQLTLATCEALTVDSTPDPALIAAAFLRWFRARRLTGLGASTLKALRDLDAGAHWALSGSKGERAAGNGAAMRIAPLAFCLDPLTETSRQLIRDVGRITHHNDEACVGALAVVLAIKAMLAPEPSLKAIATDLPDTSVRDRLLAYAALTPEVGLIDAARRHGTSGYVAESVPFAIFAGQRAAQLGFAEMLRQVIMAGGDTDTNASLACQLAGTALGFKALPADLVAKLPQAEMVVSTARSFAEAVAKTATQPAPAGETRRIRGGPV